MVLDCAVIGGGPAGLSAALVLGRARRKITLFDEGKPANAVTRASHGFVTRDGVSPNEFRRIAHQEIGKYPSVAIQNTRVTRVSRHNSAFQVTTGKGDVYHARNILLATGLKAVLPAIDGIYDYFGRSLFTCPYCDGWELTNKRLVVVSGGGDVFHLTKLVWNWSKDLMICTQGHDSLTPEQKATLLGKGIQISEDKITALDGENGKLKRVVFATNQESVRDAGFLAVPWLQASSLSEDLGCDMNALGGIVTDDLGRTSVEGVYAAGDTKRARPTQLIGAAAEGSMAATGVNMSLTEREFM